MLTTELWYKNAVVYALEVATFMDGNDDGIGDFQGLTRRLDYLASLGVNCIWLLPFHPSPNRDDGYDVSDYYGVDPRLGSLGDFVVFMREARDRGLHVLMDLVINHTSDRHGWFQAARRHRYSRFRDFYIWAANPRPAAPRNVAFPGEQGGNWAYDSEAGAYYWHSFYEHQPDLNTANPQVLEEFEKIMGFWLELGVSGFRIDAAPFLIHPKGADHVPQQVPQAFLQGMRDFLVSRRSDAVLLAEADVDSGDIPLYFGEGDRMHLVLNFILNNYFFLALARQNAEPLVRGLETLPDAPSPCQWANFVRNHDELNLAKLTDRERSEVYEAFAPEPPMRIYGRGIRRRLPPMLCGERNRMEMAYSLLFSLPGTPVLRYGEEIGMGDDLSLAGRMSVRTPMQWTAAEGGGFSAGRPDRLVRPLISDGPFSVERVNVDDQRADPDSFLNRISRLIRARRESPEIGSGSWQILEAGAAEVLAHRCTHGGRSAVALHNLSGHPVEVRLELSEAELAAAVDLLGDRRYEPLEGSPACFTMESFGYRWIRVRGSGRRG